VIARFASRATIEPDSRRPPSVRQIRERVIDNARLTVSQIVVCSFKDLKMAYPQSGGARDHEPLEIVDQLTG
jgi:hypothetical protein